MTAGHRAASVLAGIVVTLLLGSRPASSEPRDSWPQPIDDTQRYGKLLFDRLEYGWGDSEDVVLWDAQLWYGGDYDRLWIETEGEDVVAGGDGGEIEKLDVLYSHRFSPYWDVQIGPGYQRVYGPGPDHQRALAVAGVQGLAPYWFEVDANLRLSHAGDLSSDLEVEYDWLLTQRLILQPRFETTVAFSQVRDFGVGKGVNYVQMGLRLRYQIRREFAPYVGFAWQRKLGDSADLAREEGEDIDNPSLVAGVRMWF